MEKKPSSKVKLLVIIASIVVAAAVVLAITLPKTVKQENRAALAASEESIAYADGQNKGGTKDSGGGKEEKGDEAKKSSKDKNDEKDSEKDKDGKNTCKLTISNGAASANTKEAVNGLHVYSPDSADLEDFFSGQEVPVGTKVSIYVYNLASPVSLHIEHNGQVVADRTYAPLEAWVDDDKVEFFELTLEGDLLVQTTALSDTENVLSWISINNESLGQVMLGNQNVHDGNSFRNGSSDLSVSRTVMDVNVYVSVDGVAVGYATLTEYSPVGYFPGITYNNSQIQVYLEPVNHNEPVPDPPKKSTVSVENGNLANLYCGSDPLINGYVITNGVYDFKVITSKKDIKMQLFVGDVLKGEQQVNAGMNEYSFSGVIVDGDVLIVLTDVTPEITEKSYKVVIKNKVKKTDASLDIGYVDENEKPVTIKSGKKYASELIIGARALNYNSDRELLLTAYNSKGKKLDSVTIPVGTKQDPGANGFYLMLTGKIKYVLEYADEHSEEETEDPTKPDDGKEDPTKPDDGKEDPTKPDDGKEDPTKPDDGKEDPTKPEEKQDFKVKVQNGAESANTDEAVNGLHVYSMDDPDMEDIYGTVTLKKGTKIRIYAYPLASAIHLKIVHGKEVIVDKDIAKMQAWVDDDKIEFFDITLKENLTVTTTAIQSSTKTLEEAGSSVLSASSSAQKKESTLEQAVTAAARIPEETREQAEELIQDLKEKVPLREKTEDTEPELSSEESPEETEVQKPDGDGEDEENKDESETLEEKTEEMTDNEGEQR